MTAPGGPAAPAPPADRLARLTWVAAALCTVVILDEAGVDGTLLLVPAATAVWLARHDLSGVVRVYLGAVAVALVVAPRCDPTAVLATGRQEGIDAYAALWITTGVLAGTVTPRARRPAPAPTPALVPVLVAAAGCLLVQAVSLRADAVGVAAQYAGGSSGGGYLGLLGAVGPAIAGGGVLAARAAGRLRSTGGRLAVALLGADAVLLACTGFRGTGPILLLAVGLVAAGAAGQPRIRSRAVAAVLLAAAVTALFLLGAGVRTRAVSTVPDPGAISEPVGVGNLFTTVAARLDYAPYLARAVYLRDDPGARSAVRLTDQALAGVPRVLEPGKSPVSYGQQVATRFFDLPAGAPTAATITSLGDGLVNVGRWRALIMIGIYLAGLDTAFRYLCARPDPRNLALLVGIATPAFDVGSPVLLATVNALRTGLATVLVVAVAERATAGHRSRRPGPGTVPRSPT